MAFLVELFRHDGEDHVEVLTCHMEAWPQLIQLGKDHGWVPMGAQPHPQSKEDWDRLGSFKDDYEPEGAEHGYRYKQVIDQDASAWADALEQALARIEAGDLVLPPFAWRCLPSFEYSDLTLAEAELIMKGVCPPFLKQAIPFFQRGAFGFGYDD